MATEFTKWRNNVIEWEPLALSLINILDKCKIYSEEVTYPIAANVFNGVEMALSVILVMADTINDERQSFILPRPNAMQCCQDPLLLDLTLLCHVEFVVPGILGAQLGRIDL